MSPDLLTFVLSVPVQFPQLPPTPLTFVDNGTSNSIVLDENNTHFNNDINLNNNSILNCGNCQGFNGSNGINGTNGTSYNSTEFNNSINMKVNKSGDNITGKIYTNDTLVYQNNTDMLKVGSFTILDQPTTGTPPGQTPALFTAGRWYDGVAFQSGKYMQTVGYTLSFTSAQNQTTTRGFRIRSFPPQSNTPVTFFLSNENETVISSLKETTITNLSGTGNRPICADPNGRLVIC